MRRRSHLTRSGSTRVATSTSARWSGRTASGSSFASRAGACPPPRDNGRPAPSGRPLTLSPLALRIGRASGLRSGRAAVVRESAQLLAGGREDLLGLLAQLGGRLLGDLEGLLRRDVVGVHEAGGEAGGQQDEAPEAEPGTEE